MSGSDSVYGCDSTGNELLHNLSSMGPVSLRVDLRSGNDTAYAHYSNFTIGSEARSYAIEVFGYTGTAGESRTGQ